MNQKKEPRSGTYESIDISEWLTGNQTIYST